MTLTSKPTISSRALPAADSRLLSSHLRQGMIECRESTLSLFEGIDYEMLCCQAHPDFSPVGWHLGHIGYTESLWLLEQSAGYPRQFPEYDRLFANVLPKVDRVKLPTLAEIEAYLANIREQVLTIWRSRQLSSKNGYGDGYCSTKASIAKRSRSSWQSKQGNNPVPLTP